MVRFDLIMFWYSQVLVFLMIPNLGFKREKKGRVVDFEGLVATCYLAQGSEPADLSRLNFRRPQEKGSSDTI